MSERQPDFVDECYADKDLSMLQKLTLVIPTYNRNYYLSRCLWYHAHFPFGQIIVADSSPEEKKVVNRETVEKIRSFFSANILYLEYPDERDEYGSMIYRKWNDAASHIQTKFAQNCTDKEFIIPTTSCCAIQFLEENSYYSVADGLYYQLSYDENGKEAYYIWQGEASYAADTALGRITQSLEQLVPVGMQFSIQRAENFKTIYQNLDRHNLYDIRFGEAEIEMSPILMGKTKRMDFPGSIRDLLSLKSKSMGVSSYNKSESSCSRYPLLPDYPKDRYEVLYQNLINCLKSYGTISSENDVIRVIDNFLQKRYQHKQKLLNKSQYVRKIVEKVWHAQPKAIQDKLRILLGEKMLAKPSKPASIIPPEVEIIQQIILSTLHLHNEDSVIPAVSHI